MIDFINTNNSWKNILFQEFQKNYFKNILNNYQKSIKYANDRETKIFPENSKIFNAFKITDLNDIKIVIIGQDPYYSICKKSNIPFANGLAFSVNKNCSMSVRSRGIRSSLFLTRLKSFVLGSTVRE